MTMHKISGRIRKLLKLAGNNPSPEEAANAFAMAQALASKYALDLDDIEAQGDAEQRPTPTVASMATRKVISWSRVVMWKACLGGAVSAANICGCYKSHDGLYFYGEPRNLDTACYMLDLLMSQIEEMGRNALRQRRSLRRRKSWANSYRRGCVDTVALRLQHAPEKALAEAKAEAKTEGALVRVSQAEKYLEASKRALAVKAVDLGLKDAPKRRSTVDGRAYEAGRFAGQSVNLGGGAVAALAGGGA